MLIFYRAADFKNFISGTGILFQKEVLRFVSVLLKDGKVYFNIPAN